MAMPGNVKIIDLMMGIPGEDNSGWYAFIKPMLMDEESHKQFKMPAQYMFKDIPQAGRQSDYVAYVIEQMDRYNIERSMIGIDDGNAPHLAALKRRPDRFFASYEANPNKGMEEVRKIRRLHKEYGIKAVTAFPSGLCPQVPIDDRKWYPIYATCIDLDIPICMCVGVPGPRLPLAPQKVELLDEVCWFFPELKVVMRHGAEPWEKLAWKLMLKYPNLYYMTTAFAPKHYPQEIINFANTRGADKILYAGYFPMGISLERIFKDMPHVPFNDDVWPKFLRENALRVFKLEG
ncbi:amidohydrolase family protein [Denitratisoma oestradiolicum]|uniref:Amidohydrolase n=1 Tax=Denitratisoma oestradiolicum TaxID=311182 RepID=A0A6S6XXP3_9PROT|nr:amidohydrolase family protein [Denitratisoma oestradiolicum]TWO81831.1 amidohydrolase [Denitratisoma oestradiolicum]CAB1370799.1 Amidohydrolase [Denitratisoma oestradiolicum]